MQHSFPRALALEPSLSLHRDYPVLESAIKHTLKISNGQMGEWNDEVLVFLFNFVQTSKSVVY